MSETDVVGDLMARPRVTITISEEVHEVLTSWAEKEERPLANLVAFIVTKAVKEYEQESSSPAKGKGG
ncbi:MAG: hypothetical protein F6J86_27290 [Symploca sp. SIO1B1]|nr:hypothetical protein [Symploca sp. SIO1A3]NER97511.1 hypothetical protein [Symploca sp. SIO1B1]NES17880.1 hypothetical protein [Caldora sp. SIO3E6]